MASYDVYTTAPSLHLQINEYKVFWNAILCVCICLCFQKGEMLLIYNHFKKVGLHLWLSKTEHTMSATLVWFLGSLELYYPLNLSLEH